MSISGRMPLVFLFVYCPCLQEFCTFSCQASIIHSIPYQTKLVVTLSFFIHSRGKTVEEQLTSTIEIPSRSLLTSAFNNLGCRLAILKKLMPPLAANTVLSNELTQLQISRLICIESPRDFASLWPQCWEPAPSNDNFLRNLRSRLEIRVRLQPKR